MMQLHHFSGPTTFQAKGRFFHFASSDNATSGAAPSVAVYADGASQGVFVAGDSLELDGSVNAWEVIPTDPALSGTVLIGDGRVRSSRISGTVEVVEQGAAATRVGNQYFRFVERTGAAGLFPVLAVRATQGDVLVRAIRVTSSAAGNVRIWTADRTAPPVAIGVWPPMNKYLRQADAANHVLESFDSGTSGGTDPDIPNFGTWRQLGPGRYANNWTDSFVSVPLILPNQSALFVVGQTAASTLYVEFCTEEIAA